jgi:glycosyltransferase involved in cell wall biosynthesis
MSEKKKILILTNRNLHNGPRMIREIAALKNYYLIYAIGTSAPLDKDIIYSNLTQRISYFQKVLNAFWRRLFIFKLTNRIYDRFPQIEKYILIHNFDIIITHEPYFLPCLNKIKARSKFKVVYNAHEYHPLEFDHDPHWMSTYGRYNYTLYKNYLQSIDLFVNVCDGIAQKCKEEFGIDSLVIPNAAFYDDTPIYSNVSSPIIKMIYHGGIIKSRKIEQMIKVAELLGSQYQLDIMTVVPASQQSYFESLKLNCASITNVHFIDQVPFKEIIPTINRYDLGLYLLCPNSFNDHYALPNKLFEFIQAKLAIAISPSLEMKKVVEKYDLGIVADDFTPENLAEKIKKLTKSDILRFKQNAEKAAILESAENYSKLYLQAINQLVKY